jgi:Domain of Unknown Function with PDB structure (DUF3857)
MAQDSTVAGRFRSTIAASIIGLVVALPSLAWAQDRTSAATTQSVEGDTAATSVVTDVSITVRPDRTSELIESRWITALAEAAIGSISQIELTYVEGMQTLDVLEAYTQKKDGRKIPVEAANIFHARSIDEYRRVPARSEGAYCRLS